MLTLTLYSGDWKEDMKHGVGEMKYHSKDSSNNNDNEGDDKGDDEDQNDDENDDEDNNNNDNVNDNDNDKIRNINMYSGEWRDNKPHGQGELTIDQKDFYKGSFLDGVRSGIGKMTYSSGKVLSGLWKNDQFKSEK